MQLAQGLPQEQRGRYRSRYTCRISYGATPTSQDADHQVRGDRDRYLRKNLRQHLAETPSNNRGRTSTLYPRAPRVSFFFYFYFKKQEKNIKKAVCLLFIARAALCAGLSVIRIFADRRDVLGQ